MCVCVSGQLSNEMTDDTDICHGGLSCKTLCRSGSKSLVENVPFLVKNWVKLGKPVRHTHTHKHAQDQLIAVYVHQTDQ